MKLPWSTHRVVLCKTQVEAAQALRDAKNILESLGLKLHPEKTKITHIKWGFEFLGYKLKRGKGLALPQEKIKNNPKSIFTPIPRINPSSDSWKPSAYEPADASH